MLAFFQIFNYMMDWNTVQSEYQLSTGLLSNKRYFTTHPKCFVRDFCWLVESGCNVSVFFGFFFTCNYNVQVFQRRPWFCSHQCSLWFPSNTTGSVQTKNQNKKHFSVNLHAWSWRANHTGVWVCKLGLQLCKDRVIIRLAIDWWLIRSDRRNLRWASHSVDNLSSPLYKNKSKSDMPRPRFDYPSPNDPPPFLAVRGQECVNRWIHCGLVVESWSWWKCPGLFFFFSVPVTGFPPVQERNTWTRLYHSNRCINLHLCVLAFTHRDEIAKQEIIWEILKMDVTIRLNLSPKWIICQVNKIIMKKQEQIVITCSIRCERLLWYTLNIFYYFVERLLLLGFVGFIFHYMMLPHQMQLL